MEFKPAKRTRAKLRLGISGPSGAGKTYSALMIANGITPWSDTLDKIKLEGASYRTNH